MNKTNKEWLQELPEPYCSQALASCTSPEFNANTTLVEALEGSFIWGSSPEGDTYWRKIRNNLASLTTVQGLGKQISNIINQDGDEYTDGEVIDQIVDLLRLHNLYTKRV